jgi:uncharacterized membrane protein
MHDDKQLERFVFFSDAVFAIAITLLVVEIHVPHVAYGPNAAHDAIQALADRVPEFIGFFVSFAVIGAFWAMHHRVFGMVARHDTSFIRPNLFLLMAIAFLPFSTAFMSENINQRVPHLFYLGSLMVAGLLQVLLMRRALRSRFVAHDISPGLLEALRLRLWALPITVAIAAAICFVTWPAWSNVVLLMQPVMVMLLARRHPHH